MEPTISNTIVTIQNPTEEAIVLNPHGPLTVKQVVDRYNSQIKHGAFVSLAEHNNHNYTVRGGIFVADREADGTLYLQDNAYLLNGEGADVDDIGAVCASGNVPVEPDPADLETFTVFGVNDNSEGFVAVVTATEDTVWEVGIQAGLVNKGYVNITAIIKGDYSSLDRVTV